MLHHGIRTTLRSAWQHAALTRCTFMVEQPADATPPSSQTYVASVELGSLDEIWRTYLNNANITNEFDLQGAVYALADGSLGATAAHQLFKLNATTGAVEAVVTLPTGDNPPGDSGFNRFSAFPGDGTLVLKSF